MEVIFVLLPISLLLILLALKVFSWAIEHGQFEDLDREASRILFDESESDPTASRDETP